MERWRERVRAHHAQSLRAQGLSEPSGDFWEAAADSFRTDPHRADDAVLGRLRQMVAPGEAALDVGGGGGRYALPLALHCRHVTVVEPSPSMVAVLRESAGQHGISNLSVVNAPWESAQVERADVVLSAHVLYGVHDIGPFVRKLEAHARRLVALLLYTDAPQSHLALAWAMAQGEERVTLPGMLDLMGVQWEMGIYPDLEMLQVSGPRAYRDREAAVADLRRRLYILPGTAQETRLLKGLDALLVETPDGLAVRGAPLRRLALAWWRVP